MIDKIVKLIKESQNIVLSGHIMPDGDAIGASFSLYYMIKKYDENKNVMICFNDDLPKYMEKFNLDIPVYRKIDDNIDIDLLIAVDTANIERLAVNEEDIKRAKNKAIIDHHISNTKYFDNYIVENMSSASEMTYRFLDKLGVSLDYDIARYIYLGIVNDTGNFMHPNVTSTTFYIASKLLEQNISAITVTRLVYEKSRNKAKVFSKAIIDGTFNEKTGLYYYYLSKKQILENNFSRDDLEGVADYMLSISGVEASLFMYELEEDTIKGSFRSKGKYDVNNIAQNLNGGGHRLASGFKIKMNIDNIIKKVESLL
ncbi:DHH family phosphoesterase [Oceanivirga miroungae]|uniref:Phosphoesterase RecJ domain-containing protein n=1 Tax=Oceanivirga miroungae TaxID=1130046 RepID=A0A6I8M8U0_9FUSO|nr:bifunctional oligoribonuclease/PAP phosphatase NrnA [Oceanivirga miroungae]VWL85916.1 phosphoesterase RecJ domain-containing protein [Oceanivirga miroungae]